MTLEAHSGERWGTRVGLILAMAGNAVGLGNFLRFPVQAAQNGGGTFMIPYFVSFLLLGIPLMWVEWGIGRYGGRFGHGTVPGMFDSMWHNKIAKYVGVLGIVMPLVVFIYYTYAVSWMAGFAFFSAVGDYFGQVEVSQMYGYLQNYQNIFDSAIHPGWLTLFFFGGTVLLVTFVISRGLSGGIEKLALIAMPLLFAFALILMIRVLTLPATAQGSVSEGLNFIWNPEWGKVLDAKVWLAAAGQMFFTLSLGMGTIHTYSSFLTEKDDITLTGLATGATNEFAEVVLGGTIAIPAAVVFFGIAGTQEVAQGSFDLGIVAMSVVFQQLPGPEFWGQMAGFLWFALLFIAGITSSVALASPAMAFMQEEFGVRRRQAAIGVGLIALVIGMMHVLWYQRGWYAEWDYWAGTFGLVIFAAIEIVIFSYIFGIDRGWREMHHGADIRIPGIYHFVIKWVTPLFLGVLLVWWTITEAVPTLRMQGVEDPTQIPWRWGARLMIVAMLAVGCLLVRKAWQKRPAEAREGVRGIECPACKALNRSEAAVCHSCGTALAAAGGGS